MRLLADLRGVFGGADALPTNTVKDERGEPVISGILDRLHALDEAPWGDLKGKPLDARGLAQRLHAYGVRSGKIKVDGTALQGYKRADLWDSWQRYLPAPGEAEPPEPPEPARSDSPPEVPDRNAVPEPLPQPEPAMPSPACDVPEVPQVPDLRESAHDADCAVCGEPLNPVLGWPVHPWCDPGPPMTAAELAAAGFPAYLAEDTAS